jgi:hypothetical protein
MRLEKDLSTRSLRSLVSPSQPDTLGCDKVGRKGH